MVIPTLGGGIPVTLWGSPLGADATPSDPTQDSNAILSVKAYQLATGTVWASYQCPPCNTAIQLMQSRINAYAGLVGQTAMHVDGLINTKWANAAKGVANYAINAGVTLQGGLLLLLTQSPQTLTERAHVAADLLGQIANIVGFDISRPQVNPAPSPTRPPSSGGGSMPSPTPSPGSTLPLPPDFGPPPPPKDRKPIYIAGGILAAGLLTAAVIAWK